MTIPVEPRIVGAERLSGGIIITFDDGRCALYPASLLYAALPHAIPIDEADSLPID